MPVNDGVHVAQLVFNTVSIRTHCVLLANELKAGQKRGPTGYIRLLYNVREIQKLQIS
jgi:hypothetical protein